MPELPEVETVARGLAARIAGRIVTRVDLRRRDILHGRVKLLSRVRGSRVEEVRRYGKQVLIRLDGPASLVVHLGMSGGLLVCVSDEPLPPHTHLRIRFREPSVAGDAGDQVASGRDKLRKSLELRFSDPRRFGGVWLVRPDDCAGAAPGGGAGTDGWVGRRLPPVKADPLAIPITSWKKLLNRRCQIKALLMSQRPITGLGNIYCDEALYRARIHPARRASDLSPAEIQALARSVRQVLRAAIRAGGSSISDYRGADDAPGWFQTKHRVYGREGRPCPACGTAIIRVPLAGRSTHLCPKCQPANPIRAPRRTRRG